MGALLLLGAESPTEEPTDERSLTLAATLMCAVGGGLFWRAHPVLGALNGGALGSNLSRIYTRELAVGRAAANLGAHVVATSASLAMPAYPALGYLAGVVTSNLFLQRQDSFLQRFEETIVGEKEKAAPKALLPATAESSSSASPAPVQEARSEVQPVGKPHPAWHFLLAGALAGAAGVGIYSAVQK
jgi:hypothetical protein